MSKSENDRRRTIRNSISVPAAVKGRESIDVFWTEATEIVTVSRVGASFNLKRECHVGRIVSLIMNMPKHLRSYDLETKLYRVWGLVQHCRPISEEEYQIGIAFVGKNAPTNYEENPAATYRVKGMSSDGFWHIEETKTRFIPRAYYRYPNLIDVKISVLDSEGKDTFIDEKATTKNISTAGAAVFSDLDVNSGDAVRFTCDEQDFSSIAIVRNRQEKGEGRTTLHLQFTECDFPIDKIMQLSKTTDIEESEDINNLKEISEVGDNESTVED